MYVFMHQDLTMEQIVPILLVTQSVIKICHRYVFLSHTNIDNIRATYSLLSNVEKYLPIVVDIHFIQRRLIVL